MGPGRALDDEIVFPKGNSSSRIRHCSPGLKYKINFICSHSPPRPCANTSRCISSSCSFVHGISTGASDLCSSKSWSSSFHIDWDGSDADVDDGFAKGAGGDGFEICGTETETSVLCDRVAGLLSTVVFELWMYSWVGKDGERWKPSCILERKGGPLKSILV